MTVQVIAGLGNPGSDYARTRHNAGFWVVDALARAHGATWRHENRFSADVAELRLGRAALRLLKPHTFMNHSGRSVAALTGFFRVPPEQLLVVHDELDLPPGELRLKRGGGHGGHNGLRDILRLLPGAAFLRLRVGIGHPGHRDDVTAHVLRAAPADEQIVLDRAIDRAVDLIPFLIDHGLERAMQRLHSPPA